MRRSYLLLLVLSWLAGCKLPGSDGPVSQRLLTSRHYSQQGLAAMEQENWDRAEDVLARAVRACPTDVEARRHYAEALWHRGRRQEAMAQLNEASRLVPEDATIYVRLAEMRLDLGQVAAARQAAEQGLDLDPKVAQAWAVHGRVMCAAGDFRQALGDYHRALGYAPNERQILLDVAEAYRQLNEPQRAMLTLQKLNDTYPPGEEPPQVMHLLGLAYSATGRYDDAVETLTAAMLRDRPTPELLARLAEIQLARGHGEEAASAAREALSLDPNHAPSQQILARVEQARQSQTALR
jgi:tetratricopeptide (TPR) repeat protein